MHGCYAHSGKGKFHVLCTGPVFPVITDTLFEPQGAYWRVNRESILLLGGGTALLLELAHPLVAAAVAEHSDFRERPVRRLTRTMNAMQTIVYGERATALAKTASMREMHRRIRGNLGEETAMFPRGTPYCAADPELLRWVYATLIQTSLHTYESFLPPLGAAGREAYYAESKTLAREFGVPEDLLPPTYPDFLDYWHAMIEGPTLDVTDEARELGRNVLYPPIAGLPHIVGDLGGIITLGLLPETIRQRFGFKWDAKRQRAWGWGGRLLRKALPYMPELARASGSARRAERLVART